MLYRQTDSDTIFNMHMYIYICATNISNIDTNTVYTGVCPGDGTSVNLVTGARPPYSN